MGNEDNQVQKVEVRRMTGRPILTDVYGIFEKIELESGNGRTIIYKSVKPFGFGKRICSIKIEPHFNSMNSGLDYRA